MEIWLRCFPYRKELVTFAMERGVSSFWVPDGNAERLKRLGRVNVISKDGDLVPGVDLDVWEIEGSEDLESLYSLSSEQRIYIDAKRREIIPLENLVAMGKKIYVPVRDLDDLRVFSGVLEKGVTGIVLEASSEEEIASILKELPKSAPRLQMSIARISSITILGLGDRVCVDTCSIMKGSVGMLVGNSSKGFFLVSAENVHSEYVNERPFRVNAGAVHMYTLLPSGKTSYLSEICSGSQVMIVGSDGLCETAYAGRAKVEKRPLIMICAESDGKEVSAILQNAETIRVIASDGTRVSMAEIEEGMEILCFLDEGGRHFGIRVDESIEEK